jgi:hypothetical protein
MKLFSTLFLIFFSLTIWAQNSAIEGVVKDRSTGETLIGANIVFTDNPGKGTVTGIDGDFKLPVNPGTYSITISYVGYKSQVRKVKVGEKPTSILVELNSEMLGEVLVTADVAIDRKTPVAHMTLKPAKIEAELAGRDMPMILNSTPGVYATSAGGGEGDAEVRIRGFQGNFVGVLLDGIPVNDMENGWVYWSNWFGLSTVTRSMNVQRGLGASKLAIPSIGGTINILTKGIDNKKEFKYSEEIDNFGKFQHNAGFNSGQLENGWSYTLAASYKHGSGWAEETDFEGYFYFFKLNKRHKKHLFTFTAFGAPQWHNQRKYSARIATYDASYAEQLGVDLNDPEQVPIIRANDNDLIDEDIPLIDKGIGYNSNWGWLRRDRHNPGAALERVHTARNEYFKPMFYIKDFWNINEQMSLSNIAYLSIGRGGGTNGISEEDGTGGPTNKFTPDGHINLQWYYNQNSGPVEMFPGFYGPPPIYPEYHPTKYRSKYVIPMNVNEHFWLGYLSTFNYKMNSYLTHDAGIDLRHYEGTHYRKVYDLLGGDYFIDVENNGTDLLGVNDKYYFHDVATVSWGGIFYQAEYSTPVFTAIINATGNVSSFKKNDIMGDTISDRKTLFGWTIKGGVNYNVGERINVFANAGYYDKVQGSSYIYQGYTTHFTNLDNERIKSVEIGSMLKGTKIRATVNAYITRWENRPTQLRSQDDDENSITATTGLEALHKGIEFDMTYDPIKQVQFESWLSFGDWIWDTDKKDIPFYDVSGEYTASRDLNLVGIHISDAAQTQVGFAVNFKPIKGLYFKVKTTYFDRYYADARTNLNVEEVQDSWRIPAYQTFDIHAGYNFGIPGVERVRFKLALNVLNLTDELYISSATNNDSYTTGFVDRKNYDAASAVGYFGAPRRFILKFGVNF